jgi:hypothetical protein
MRHTKLFMFLILLLCAPLIIGWTSVGIVESSMREFGFKLKKKEQIAIPYTDRTETRYTFTHKIHHVVIVDEYHNGFIEIKANYKSSKKDPNPWNLTVRRSVKPDVFRDTIYRIFVLGDTR